MADDGLLTEVIMLGAEKARMLQDEQANPFILRHANCQTGGAVLTSHGCAR